MSDVKKPTGTLYRLEITTAFDEGGAELSDDVESRAKLGDTIELEFDDQKWLGRITNIVGNWVEFERL